MVVYASNRNEANQVDIEQDWFTVIQYPIETPLGSSSDLAWVGTIDVFSTEARK